MDITVSQICRWMEEWADPAMAESYDNVGLLIGRCDRKVKTLVTALDATEAVIAYAIEKDAQMIVTHHPMPFRPVRRITDESRDGGRILSLAVHQIALYAAHTNLDCAIGGTNDMVARRLGLLGVHPLVPKPEFGQGAGMGRIGTLPEAVKLETFLDHVKRTLAIPYVRVVSGTIDRAVLRVALCTGSGMEFVQNAYEQKADVYLTGDITYHGAEEALTMDMVLVDGGHYGTEQIAAEEIREYLMGKTSDLKVIRYPSGQDVFQIC